MADVYSGSFEATSERYGSKYGEAQCKWGSLYTSFVVTLSPLSRMLLIHSTICFSISAEVGFLVVKDFLGLFSAFLHPRSVEAGMLKLSLWLSVPEEFFKTEVISNFFSRV